MQHKNIKLLKFYQFFYGFRPYEAIAVIYFTQVTGSFTQGLAVFSICSIVSALAEVPTGILSDRIGRRWTLLAASVAGFMGISLYSLAYSFAALALGALFIGLSWAFLSGNNEALLYDTLKESGQTDSYAKTYGRTSSLFEVGLGISALLAGLSGVLSLRAIMALAILPRLLCIVIAWFIVEPSVHTNKISENVYAHLKDAIKAYKNNRQLRRLGAAHILNGSIEEAYYQFKPAFIASLWPVWALGISRALDNLFGFLGYHFAGKIIKRFRIYRTLLVQEILGRAIVFVAAGFTSMLSPLLLNINAFFFGVGETTKQTLMQQEFTDEQRATMGSLTSLAGSLLFAALMLVIGQFADSYGVRNTILLLAALSVPGVLLFWSLHKDFGRD